MWGVALPAVALGSVPALAVGGLLGLGRGRSSGVPKGLTHSGGTPSGVAGGRRGTGLPTTV